MNATSLPLQRPNLPLERFIPNPKLKFMEQCREVMRFRRLALRSEQTYLDWIKRFIFFHDKRHPKDMGEIEVQVFLSHLAADLKVAASTQNQALNSLVFLYRHVLGRPLGLLDGVERAKRLPRVPVVLSQAEVSRLMEALPDKYRLFFKFLYGTGLRLMEALRLRVKDVDFERNQIIVRGGKGDKDRVTMLPESLKSGLEAQLRRVAMLHLKGSVLASFKSKFILFPGFNFQFLNPAVSGSCPGLRQHFLPEGFAAQTPAPPVALPLPGHVPPAYANHSFL
jgi:integrase